METAKDWVLKYESYSFEQVVEALKTRDAEVRAAALREALLTDEAWPLKDIIAKLIEATEHLLIGHNCDAHGWELFGGAARRGKEWLDGYERLIANAPTSGDGGGT